MTVAIAQRFVDEYQPGDNIPAGRYAPSELERMAEKRLVIIVPKPAPPAPAPPPRKSKRKSADDDTDGITIAT